MKRINCLKSFGAKIFVPRNEFLKPKNQTGFRGIQEYLPNGTTTTDKKLHRIYGTKSHTNKLNSSFNKILTTSVLPDLALLMRPSRLHPKIQPQKEQVLSLVRV